MQTDDNGEPWHMPIEAASVPQDQRTTQDGPRSHAAPDWLPLGTQVHYRPYHGWPTPDPQPYLIWKRRVTEQNFMPYEIITYCLAVDEVSVPFWVDAGQVQRWEES